MVCQSSPSVGYILCGSKRSCGFKGESHSNGAPRMKLLVPPLLGNLSTTCINLNIHQTSCSHSYTQRHPHHHHPSCLQTAHQRKKTSQTGPHLYTEQIAQRACSTIQCSTRHKKRSNMMQEFITGVLIKLVSN